MNSEIINIAPSTHENPEFKDFIKSVLSRAELSSKYIDLLTDDSAMIEFTKSFTHKSVSPVDNYEFYEIVGDATTNKVVVLYFVRRFPELFNEAKGKGGNMGPVGVMARLKQNGISKKTYSKFADSLGFWKFARYNVDEHQKDKTKILEDIFESFCGCLELLIDIRVTMHSGYCIIYKIMKTLMDELEIKLDRESLYDAKSRLNEVVTGYKKRVTIQYVSEEDSSTKYSDDPQAYKRRFNTIIKITDTLNNNKVYSSTKCFGHSKPDSEQKCAQYVLDSKIFDNIK